ncbi:MAG TPA: hypothetical protein VMX38_09475, partial [Verrucomicrobiae bacterium]|nr:hypothetical protein [Verrucomicrobiae bacterium]
PHCCWIVRITVRVEHEDSVYPSSFSGSNDCPQVPGRLDRFNREPKGVSRCSEILQREPTLLKNRAYTLWFGCERQLTVEFAGKTDAGNPLLTQPTGEFLAKWIR